MANSITILLFLTICPYCFIGMINSNKATPKIFVILFMMVGFNSLFFNAFYDFSWASLLIKPNYQPTNIEIILK